MRGDQAPHPCVFYKSSTISGAPFDVFLGRLALPVNLTGYPFAMGRPAFKLDHINRFVEIDGDAKPVAVGQRLNGDDLADKWTFKIVTGHPCTKRHRRAGKLVAAGCVQRIPVTIPELVGKQFQCLAVGYVVAVGAAIEFHTQAFGLLFQVFQRWEGKIFVHYKASIRVRLWNINGGSRCHRVRSTLMLA